MRGTRANIFRNLRYPDSLWSQTLVLHESPILELYGLLSRTKLVSKSIQQDAIYMFVCNRLLTHERQCHVDYCGPRQ